MQSHACYIHWCSNVEVVVDMLHVPSLWLLLDCVHLVLIRILYSLFVDERGIYHYLLQLTKCKHFVCYGISLCMPRLRRHKNQNYGYTSSP